MNGYEISALIASSGFFILVIFIIVEYIYEHRRWIGM